MWENTSPDTLLMEILHKFVKIYQYFINLKDNLAMSIKTKAV